MANSVDDRIVSIQFDNRAFEKDIANTLNSLAELRKSLDFSGASKGLDSLGASASGSSSDLSGMASAVDNISSKFSTLGAIGFSVIQSLTQSALGFASQISGLVLDPLVSGGKARATNIANAQFQFKGLGIDVTQAMNSALTAVKGTAFGLDEAAKAAAQFGASGVGAGAQMTTALRAIAGAAAMTNSSFSDISDIFTSVAGIGTLGNEDLNRFAVRGLNATAVLAKALGKTQAQIHEMARDGKIDFTTFAKIMDDAFGAHATQANETYTGALANMHAALSRLGASFFGPKMEQQRQLFNALSPVIDNVNAALQPLIKSFLDIRGIGVGNLIKLINGLDLSQFKVAIPNFALALTNGFQALTRVLDIAKASFRDVFPPNTTSVILTISQALLRFSQSLKFGTTTGTEFRQIFNGIFDTFAILFNAVKVVGELFGKLFQTMDKAAGLGNGGILKFFADLGVKMTLLKIALVNGGGLEDAVFSFVSSVHDLFVKLQGDIVKAVSYIENLFGIVDKVKTSNFDDTTDSVGRLTSHLSLLGTISTAVAKAWQFLIDHFNEIGTVVRKGIDSVVNMFTGLGHAIAGSIRTGNFDEIFDTINSALIAGILGVIIKFMHNGFSGIGLSFINRISQAFNTLTQTLQSMQLKLKAEALKQIAEAVAILAAAMVVLSLINSEALTKALTAMGTGFALLVGSMALLDKLASGAGKIALLSTAMIGMASAILILSAAVRVLSTLSWSELTKGLTGVAVLLGAVTVVVNFMPESGAMVRAGVGITGIAIGVRVLASAVKAMASLSWGDMTKGLIGVAAALGVLVGAMQLMPNGLGMALAGAGIIEVAFGLNILAAAVKLFSLIKFGDMVKGLIGIGGALLVIAGAMQLMPLSLPITGAGLILVGAGLTAVAAAMKIFASMSLKEMAIGLGGVAATLAVLAIATMAMSGTLAGSASIFVAASALSILAKVIKTIGGMKWQDIVRGLAGIAGSLTVLGVAAALITPTIPSLLGLGVALALVGAGFALFGIGAAGVANALKLIADTGSTAIDALIAIFNGVIKKVPALAVALAEGLVKIAEKVTEALPGILLHVGEILVALLQALDAALPELAKTIGILIDNLLKIIVTKFPDFVNAGLQLLLNLLDGILNNIQQVTSTVVAILVLIIQTLAEDAGSLIGAGLGLLIAILQGIADNIGLVLAAVANIITAIISGLSSAIDQIIQAGTDLITNLIVGIVNAQNDIIQAGITAAGKFLDGLVKDTKMIANKLGNFIVGMLDALTAAIKKFAPEIREAGEHLAGAILDGMTFGLSSKVGGVAKAAVGVAGKALGALKGAAGFFTGSPSRKTYKIGQQVAAGLATAFSDDLTVGKSAASMASDALDNMNSALNSATAAVGIPEIGSPTITPVVDLSNVKQSASMINDMIKSTVIDPTLSFTKAAEISLSTNQNGSQNSEPPSPIVRDVKFEQTINAPKELSASDIYRNTKTQFALAKEELAKV